MYYQEDENPGTGLGFLPALALISLAFGSTALQYFQKKEKDKEEKKIEKKAEKDAKAAAEEQSALMTEENKRTAKTIGTVLVIGAASVIGLMFIKSALGKKR